MSNAGYGQNGVFWDLPVNDRPRLRAKWRFLRFARKIQSPVTGKMAFLGICPQMADLGYGQNGDFLGFARKIQSPVSQVLICV